MCLHQTTHNTFDTTTMANSTGAYCEVCECAHGELHRHAGERQVRQYLTDKIRAAKQQPSPSGYVEFELPPYNTSAGTVLSEMLNVFELLGLDKDTLQANDEIDGWAPLSIRTHESVTKYRVKLFSTGVTTRASGGGLFGWLFSKQ
jgi:hypothetical protein